MSGLIGHIGGDTKVRGRPVWVYDWVDPLTGRRRRKIFPKTKAGKEAAEAVQLQVSTAPRPAMVHPLLDPDIALEPFAFDWFWRQVTTEVWTRSGTIALNRDRLCRYILGFRLDSHRTLGAVRVRDLSRGHVEALVEGMRKAGFAPRTTASTYRLCSAVLDRAVAVGLLPRHPIDRDTLKTIIRPLLKPSKASTIKAFTEDQMRQFLAVTAQHSRLHDLYLAGFGTGARLGELLGLQLPDDQMHVVDGRRVRQLRIERSLCPGSTITPVCGPTKNGQCRQIDVGADLGALFDRLRADRPKLALQHGWRPIPPWTFVSVTGHVYYATAVRYDFKRWLAVAGLAHTGFSPHSMRHSFAVMHIRRGVNAKWLQQQMGHKSISVTLDTYGDWFRLSDTQAADALGAAVFGNTLGNTAPR